MPVEYEKRITRQMVRSRPDVLFVFGDNLACAGLGGQARAMRGEPNAVGIPTKRAPSMEAWAMFMDADFAEVRPRIDAAMARLRNHLVRGCTVVMPADGIGTGLAELPKRAPKIDEYLQRRLGELVTITVILYG